MSKQVTDARRKNNIYGETDYILLQFLKLGGTAVFKSPDGTTLYGRGDTGVYIMSIIASPGAPTSAGYCVTADEKSGRAKFYLDGKKVTFLQ